MVYNFQLSPSINRLSADQSPKSFLLKIYPERHKSIKDQRLQKAFVTKIFENVSLLIA